MKVAMIDPAAWTLPYDDALCAAMAARGHDVTLYTTHFTHGTAPTPHGYAMDEWFYRRRPPVVPQRLARALQHPFDMRRLRRHLLRDRPDVVHVQWSVVNRIDVPMWGSLPVPVVLTVHDPVGRPGKGVDCNHLRSFDALVAHSEFGVSRLRERCGVDNVVRIRMGTFDAFQDEPEPAQPVLPQGKGPVVSLPGLLRPYKGVDTLLAAWPAVREQVPDAQLVLAGRPMGLDLPDPAPEGVTIIPRFLDEAEFASVLRGSDIVALPYREIDLSAVLFSALAVGTPLVLSDIGGFSEFGNGEGAELVPPEDPAALAATIARLLRDPDRLAELSRQAKAARERYSWESIAQVTEQLYERLASGQYATLAPAGTGA